MKATKQQQALLRAVDADDLKQVRALLRQKADPDFPGKSNKTPLQQAIRNGNLAIVKALVGAGADVNRKNANGDNPLDIAYAKGEYAIITYLRTQGAREASDTYGYYFNGASRKAAGSKTPKTAKAAKATGTAAKGGSKKPARFYMDDWDDDGWDDDSYAPAPRKTAAKKAADKKPVTADSGKPVFTADNLKDIFNAAQWVGKTQDMAKLWEDVPARLKKKFDFEAAFTAAQQETLHRDHPRKLALKPRPKSAAPAEKPDNGGIPADGAGAGKSPPPANKPPPQTPPAL